MSFKLRHIWVYLAFIFCANAAAENSNTIYGDFRYSLNSIDTTSTSTSGDNNASRLGFKGEVTTSTSLKAFYHLQMAVNIDGGGSALNERFYMAGLKGKHGTLAYGRTSSAYKMAGLRLDPFYDSSAGLGFGGSNFGLSPLTNSWTDNTLAYTTPAFSNVTLNAATFIDDSDEDDHDFNLGGIYKGKNYSVGLQYVNVGDSGVLAKSTPDSNAVRLHASATMGQWTLNGSFESIDVSQSQDQDYQYVSAVYQHSDPLKFAASYGRVNDVSATADGDGFSLGGFYELPTKTVISLIYSTVDLDSGADRDIFAIGVSQKFSLTF